MPNRRLTQPPRLGGALPRPRLFRLNEGNEPARLLVGPSGCGKTVAASQLLAAAPAGTRTAWTRLVPEMNEAGDVAGLLAEALGQPRPGAAPGTTMEAAELVLDLLGERPVWWVVDDYHAPPPATVDALFAEVLASAPEPHRFFLCSRWRPPGLLGRTGTGLVRVVGEEDLAFTAEEARQLVAGSALSGAAITELWSATRGSPSALAVCAQAGWASVDQAVDLLVDQLLTLSEGACQEALTALALVSELNAAEVTAAGIPRSALDRLVEIGPLVQVEGGCWRLLEAARPRVLERSAEDVSLLRRRLAAGRAEEDPLSAARLLLDADDEVGAAELLAERATDLAPVEVVPFLYRLSADIRRALPPVLSAAQATVELDRALPAAEQRVARATRPVARARALVGLGSTLAHQGRLGEAADPLSRLDEPRPATIRPRSRPRRGWRSCGSGPVTRPGPRPWPPRRPTRVPSPRGRPERWRWPEATMARWAKRSKRCTSMG